MKTLTKLALVAALLTTTIAAQAGGMSGHIRTSGSYAAPHYRASYGTPGSGHSSRSSYVYRNPYAASPSVSVRSYTRTDQTYVAPHVRTAPNFTQTDNLNYRGYGTVRVPRNSLGR